MCSYSCGEMLQESVTKSSECSLIRTKYADFERTFRSPCSPRNGTAVIDPRSNGISSISESSSTFRKPHSFNSSLNEDPAVPHHCCGERRRCGCDGAAATGFRTECGPGDCA